jgi:hypothetical protein
LFERAFSPKLRRATESERGDRVSAGNAESGEWVARVRAALAENAAAQRETAETCARAGGLCSPGLTGKGGGKLAAAQLFPESV